MLNKIKQKKMDKMAKSTVRGLKDMIPMFKDYNIQVTKLEALTESMIDSIESLDENNVTLKDMSRIHDIQNRFIETLGVVSSALDNLE